MTENKNKNTALWVVADAAPPEAASAISDALGVSAALGRLLYKRGCHTPDEARSFLRFEGESLYDPYLLPDMRTAVEKIMEAVKAHRKIMIYGDYDADGVTSVSVLYLYLSGLGADVGYYIPKRSEGYGMSECAVRQMAEDGVGLIITVDTGVTAISEIRLARELGIDVVVTDHHECIDELPCAAAVVNPQRRDNKYPFVGLAGVGVVYKLLCALETAYSDDGDTAAATLRISEKYIDLVAIGTVADVMPVLDENRIIVSYGLSRIENTTRPGLRALMEACASSGDTARRAKKTRVTSGYISFTLAPRINAAGRMGDASLAVALFLSKTETEAAALASKLCEVNRERQQLENIIAGEAYEKIEATHDFEHDPVIVVADEGWHHGIIGIVASRVTEKYGRPSILISFEGDGGSKDIGKGSGRSVHGLNLAFALCECGDLLIKCGGHELAAGLTIERGKLDEFRRRINEVARQKLAGVSSSSVVNVDDTLKPDELTLGLAEEIRMLEPYGVGNPTPVFMTEDMPVVTVTGVGANKHTKLTLGSMNSAVTGMVFSVSPEELGFSAGSLVDVLYNIEINEFRGELSLQLIVRAIRKSASQVRHETEARMLYEALRSGTAEMPSEYDDYIPGRSELAALYRVLRGEISAGKTEHTAGEIESLVSRLAKVKVNYVSVRLSLDIFAEMGILNVCETAADTFTVGLPAHSEKVDLEKSRILSMLREKYLH